MSGVEFRVFGNLQYCGWFLLISDIRKYLSSEARENSRNTPRLAAIEIAHFQVIFLFFTCFLNFLSSAPHGHSQGRSNFVSQSLLQH